MSETAQDSGQAKAKKSETTYTPVTMADGRVVQFAGARKVQKSVIVDKESNAVTVRFDVRNGKSIVIDSRQLSNDLILLAVGHGLSQKGGDNAAGEKDEDDIFEAIDDIRKQLVEDGTWNTVREAGDSFSGASVVIRAVAEATGKSVEFVKAHLQAKLDKAKAAGEKLTRQALYASFRRPGTKTAEIINRMEQEKAAKSPLPDANDLLAEMA